MPNFLVELEFADGTRSTRTIFSTDANRAASFAEAHTPPFDVPRKAGKTTLLPPSEPDGKIEIRTVRGETRARIADSSFDKPRRTIGGY